MKVKLGAAAAVIAAVGYSLLALQRATEFDQLSGVGIAFAISIVAVVVVTMALIVRELLFGLHMSRMAKAVSADLVLPSTSSGRAEPAAAAAAFEQAKARVEAEPENWQAWFQVALAYDAARDRKRARAAMREAEKLFRRAG